MTREEFTAWITGGDGPVVQVPAPFDIEPCACRAVGCKGWRLVPAREPLRLRYDDVQDTVPALNLR